MNDADFQGHGDQARPISGVGYAGDQNFQQTALPGLCPGIHADGEFDVDLKRTRLVAIHQFLVDHDVFSGVLVHADVGFLRLRSITNVPLPRSQMP